MFNIFKTSASDKVAVAGKTTNQIIEEIHESFYTEVDRLLADAKVAKSLDTNKQELIEKCGRLKRLGFTNTKEVKEAESEIKRLDGLKKENESKKKLMDAIHYFSFKYPNYKFITEESVKKICQKYGLVYGGISRYTGTVPDKNLAQMEQFKIDEDDSIYLYKEVTLRATTLRQEYLNHHQYLDFNTRGFTSIREICDKCPLEIAAPAKDFNLEGMEVKDFQISKIEIPDPVVLQPVIYEKQKYYLIVTAWGIEASDAEVVNERMN